MNMGAKLLCSLYVVNLLLTQAYSYELVPRWGQATVLINNALIVHGGKTDPFNSYGYTSAPNNNDTLYLSLSSSFDTAAPPWQLLSTSSDSSSAPSPSLSWHTLSALNSTHLLLFGGQPGPNSPVVLTGVADSVFLIDVTESLQPLWTLEPVAWADEPIRRIHHFATSTPSGNVYIIGGEKADDSSISFAEHYVFNPGITSFTALPTSNAPPGLTGHASVFLSDGRLLVFGGYSQSSGGLLPLSTIWVLDSSQSPPSWSNANVSGTFFPSPRRAFASTSISGGKVLIHGGSDASLQTNYADGWVLDPLQDPMIWTQHDALSQLGARRDHFAVSSGEQVLFCFGYGNDGPAPIALEIYNTNRDAFETTFIPPASSPTQTSVNSPSQTSPPTSTTKSIGSSAGHNSPGAHPTNSAGPKSGGPNGGGDTDDPNEDSKQNRTAIAVGSALGLLGLVVVVLTTAYYIRRRRERSNAGNFRTLDGGSHGDDDGESEHLAGSIPAAGSSQRDYTFRSRPGWDFGILDTLGLATGLMIGTRHTRHAPERKDMLADEDTRDFAPWYDVSRQGSTLGRAWSFRSIIPSLKRSREPSVADSMRSASWREKADPFSDSAALIGDEETGYLGASASPGRRQQSYTSTRSYNDPFMDPLPERSHDNHEEERGQAPNEPFLYPIPPRLPSLRTILPVSQGAHLLSPLTEQTSRTTLNDTSTSNTSHTTSHNSRFDTISSLTSHTSFDPPKSLLSPSSLMGPTTPMKRSDSWWSRFSRTSFLDRRSSDASRRMPDIRDPNPPPRLGAIVESSHTTSLIDRQQSSSSGQELAGGLTRDVSRLQGGHNKSQSSVRTADTEAIERMARTMDVAHLMRSDSRRTASTTTTSLSIDNRHTRYMDENRGAGSDPEQTFLSPIEMTDVEAFSCQGDAYHLPTAPVVHVMHTSDVHPKHTPPSSGAVAARIQEFERRLSHDLDTPLGPLDRKKQSSKHRTSSQPVNYGLIPRASLFVANPDLRTLSSADASS
ncbi:hypothetical protein H0H87_008843 [Tephrocybe sp. NHM501043]|nr:hypothetical protein H0H87_008843 [Tephrocybe sp. NHM501043]